MNLVKNIFFILILLSSVMAVASIESIEARYKALLNLEYRPDTPVMYRIVKKHSENPFLDFNEQEENLKTSERMTWSAQKQTIENMGSIALGSTPHMIARIEAVYPNAKIYFLGRDAAPLADVFQAYYDSIGQKNRVYRVHASRDTVYNMSQEDTLKLFKKVKAFKTKNRPVVLLDRTSFATNSQVGNGKPSQSRYLYNHLYEHFVSLGMSQEELSLKLGVASTYSGWTFNNLNDVASALLENGGSNGALNIKNGKKMLTDTALWNASYTVGLKLDKGEYKGEISRQHGVGHKIHALAVMYEAVKVGQSQEFADAVNDELTKLGFKKSLNGKVKLRPEVLRVKEYIKANKKLINKYLEQAAAESIGMSRQSLMNVTRLLVNSGVPKAKDPITELLEELNNKGFEQGLQKLLLEATLESSPDEAIHEIISKYTVEFIASNVEVNRADIDSTLGAELRLLFSYMGPAADQGNYLSQNGDLVVKWMKGQFAKNISVTDEGSVNNGQMTSMMLIKQVLNRQSNSAERPLVVNASRKEISARIAPLISETFPLVYEAYQQGILSSKDYRRIHLYLFSEIDSDNKNDIKALRKAVEKHKELKAMLIDKAKVFITSTRFKANGAKVYKKLDLITDQDIKSMICIKKLKG